jgi:hypothetical protein
MKNISFATMPKDAPCKTQVRAVLPRQQDIITLCRRQGRGHAALEGPVWNEGNSTRKPVLTCIFWGLAKIWEGVAKIWKGVTNISGGWQKSVTCIALFRRALSNVPTSPVALNDPLAGDDIAEEEWPSGRGAGGGWGQGCARCSCPGGQAAGGGLAGWGLDGGGGMSQTACVGSE